MTDSELEAGGNAPAVNGVGDVPEKASCSSERRDAFGRFLPKAAPIRPAARSTARRRAAAGPMRRARMPVAWSARRETVFLETLAQTSCVAESIRASGFSETNVYRRRRKSAEFRARWAEALREGYVRLQGMLLDRALNGVEKPVYHGGEKIGIKREFNDATGLALLKLHREAVMGASPIATEEPIGEVRARLKAKLSEMNRRMGGAG